MQPVLVFEAEDSELRAVHKWAIVRGVPIAIYTGDLFATGRDEDNRAVVRAVVTGELDLVGLALRAPHRDAEAVLHRLRRIPSPSSSKCASTRRPARRKMERTLINDLRTRKARSTSCRCR